jgi:hypothetical protein
MQFDQTHIAVRERNFLEILDLATQVTRVHLGPLALALFVGSAPFAIVNHLLLAGFIDANEIWQDLNSYVFFLMLLVAVEAPLATAPITLYLGAAAFRERVDSRRLWRNWLASLPQLVLLEGLLRASTVLIFGAGVLIPYVRRPYLSEVILLERNPLRSTDSSQISTWRRSRNLHDGARGDLFSRWLGSVGAAIVLILAGVAGTYSLVGNILGRYPEALTVLRWHLPVVVWIVLGFFAVVRFLAYLDLRIRREGWEVELRMRAEAARLAEISPADLAVSV